MCLVHLTFDVRGRRSGEAAKGTRKRSLWAVLSTEWLDATVLVNTCLR